MSLIEAVSRLFSAGGKAHKLYQSGMKKAKNRDWAGAISDYTAATSEKGAPGDIKAMAYFNRALAYSSKGEADNAQADLKRVLGMDDAPANIKSAAKEKLQRWDKRHQH